ncbi:glycosyltransferase family 2 protein [Mesorhizobium sp. M0060]|uniref:glycosyltransferase family 2 protein n=1 Tax=Mesorhizobium sp. M0060 TaxID=2956866 RepID=UPI0033369F3F
MQVFPISVVVPVRNEERNLEDCLSRLGRFAEVVVVDSGSTDATVEIARSAGARVVEFVWNGQYPKKRNWVLMNQKLIAPWVLFLDADERISDDFCNELGRKISDPDTNGYWLNYSNFFLDKRLNFGVPQRKLALFRVGCGLYERIEEVNWSALDMEIHEHPIINGRVGTIDEKIEHNDFRGLENFLKRHLEYAKWEANRLLLLRRDGLASATHLTKRQRTKYKYISRWWYPLAYFMFAYVIKLGVFDGRAGFEYSFYKAWYFQVIRSLIDENERSAGTA